ncbi:hypothetical protein Trydic_g13055 [Trypoxylus dichotomus]
MECATIKIEEGDGLPYHICNDCRGKLHSSWAFRTLVLRSEEKLRSNISLGVSHDNAFVKEEPLIGRDENVELISTVIENANCNNGKNNREVEQSKCLDLQMLDFTPIKKDVDECSDKAIYKSSDIKVADHYQQSIDSSCNLHYTDNNFGQCPSDKPTEIKTLHLEEGLNDIENKLPVEHHNFENYRNSKDENDVKSISSSKLVKHRRKRHQAKNEKPLTKVCRTTISQKYHQKEFNCKICNQTFDSLYYLKEHRKTHKHQRPNIGERNKKFICKICGEDMQTQYKLSSHQAAHNGELYECQICKRTFPLKQSLIAHEKRHVCDAESRLICELCGKSFANIYTLRYHRETHNTEKTVPCPTCGKLFTTQKNMMSHFAWHNIRDRHICEYCNKGFKSANRKKRHVLIHTGEKPHPCKICNKRFTDTGTLSRHMLTHTGETKFACDKCPYKCRYKQQFDKHLRKHK